MTKLKLISLILLVLLKVYYLDSSHFYGGSISSRPIQDLGKKVVMEFSIRFAYRRDYRDSLNNSVTYCNQTIIDQRTLLGSNGAIQCRLNCLNKTNPEILGYTTIYCVSFSETDNWSYGFKVFNASINKDTDYQLSYISNAWVKLVKYGYNSTAFPDTEGWEVRHKIDATIRNDTGKINSSPYTLMPPIIRLPRNIQYTLPIPATDDDNDYIKCRWASWMKNECADVCEAVPFASLNNCNLVLNLTNATIGYYAVAVQIEDYKTLNDTYPFSSVPLQFLLSIGNATSCQIAPYIIGELPTDACVAENIALNLKIIATVGCLSENLTDISIIGPSGLVLSDLMPLPQYDKAWYKTLSWNVNKPGQYLICSKAIDTSFLISRQSCYTVVSGTVVPTINQTTLYPTGLITPNDIFMSFSCNYTNDVQKPNTTAYINLYSSSNNQLLYKINSAGINTTKFIENRQMSFDLPVGNLSNGNYYLTFDYGVALSTVYCKPISPKIDNSSFWTFQINKVFTNSSSTIPNPTSLLIFSTSIPIIQSMSTSLSSTISSIFTIPTNSLKTDSISATIQTSNSFSIAFSTTTLVSDTYPVSFTDSTTLSLTSTESTTRAVTQTSFSPLIPSTNSDTTALMTSIVASSDPTILLTLTENKIPNTEFSSKSTHFWSSISLSDGDTTLTNIISTSSGISSIDSIDYTYFQTTITSFPFTFSSNSHFQTTSLTSNYELISTTLENSISFPIISLNSDITLETDSQASINFQTTASTFFLLKELDSLTDNTFISVSADMLATTISSIESALTTPISTNKNSSLAFTSSRFNLTHIFNENSVIYGPSFEFHLNSRTNTSKLPSCIIPECTLSSIVLIQFLIFSINFFLHLFIFGLVFIYTISKIKNFKNVK